MRTLLIVLLLQGCALNAPYKVTEHYGPVAEERVYRVTENRLISRCITAGLAYDECSNANGLAAIHEQGKRCDIFIRDTLEPWKLECVLNHERKHCWEGLWHGNDSNSDCQ